MRYTANPFAALAPAVLLAACGGGVSLENASPAEVAEKVDAAGGAGFRPGKWETTIETVAVDIPGLEGAMKKQMTDMMLQQTQAHVSCITEAQAKSPPAEVIARTQGRCRYDTFRMSDGRIDGTLSCPAQGMGGTMKMRIAGTFDDDSFAIDNQMRTAAPGGSTMTIRAKATGKRLGDCTEAEKKAADAGLDAA